MANHYHNHYDPDRWNRRFIRIIVINFIIPAVQIGGGIISGSIALITDALHNLGDVTAIFISYIAHKISQREATVTQTFGYKRAEVLGAVLNVAILFAVSLLMAFEGWDRLHHPQPIRGGLVILIALVGVIGNAVSALILRTGARDNVNIRGAFLHMLADTLTSVGVVVVGVIWLFRPWYWLDPMISWAIVALILHNGWLLLKESIVILMNGTPAGIDLYEIKKEVESLDVIKELHHVHVWNLSSTSIAFAAHIVVADQPLSTVEDINARVEELLLCRFGIDHPILHFETRHSERTDLLCSPINATGKRSAFSRQRSTKTKD